MLVVDDNRENRAVLVDMLKPLGFRTLEAQNGREGLAKVAEAHPDLIMADLIMPEMDGFEFIRRIRQTERDATIPIIATSANVYEEDQRKSRDIGGNAFLPKPVEADRLLELLQQVLPVEWEYQESAAETAERDDTTPLIVPSQEHLNMLLECVEDGDVHALLKQLEQLEQEDVTYTAFVRQVKELATSFKMNKISALLERYLED